MKPAPKESSDE